MIFIHYRIKEFTTTGTKNHQILHCAVVYQMGISTGNLTNFHQKTLVEPTKKLTSEFGAISGAIKKRDLALSECLKRQTKVEKLDKLSNTAKGRLISEVILFSVRT